jgi:hypothetical protein
VDTHVDTLTHAQRLLLCKNMQPKTGATETGMATDSSVLPGSTMVYKLAVLSRGHRESAAASNVNAACIAAECSRLPAETVVDAPLNASSALSLRVGPSVFDRSLPSVPTVSCGLEYPPCLSSDVLRGGLSPLNTCGSDGVPPIGCTTSGTPQFSIQRKLGQDTGSDSSTIGRQCGHRSLVAEESNTV